MTDRPALEIEITPSMVEAGLGELSLFSTATDDPRVIVTAVFAAMAAAACPLDETPLPSAALLPHDPS